MRLITAAGVPTSLARVHEPTAPPVRVGLVQHAWDEDADRLRATLLDGIRTAADAGARIVFLPELTLSRYPADALPSGRPDATAESLEDGPTVTLAREAAAASGVLVHASLFERAPAPDGSDDGLGFNTAVLVAPSGQVVARTRKTHIPVTAGYHEDKYFRQGPPQDAYLVYDLADPGLRLRQALVAGVAVVVLGTPFWLTNLVLADRFQVGVGGGGEKLGGPWPVARYLWRVTGDFTAGWWPLTILVAVLVLLGLRRLPRPTIVLFACVLAVPALVFMSARLGQATSPETRHLIFALPFVAFAVAAGVVRLGRFAPVALVALLAAQVAWTWERTPQLFEWEPDVRQTARADASAYLAETTRSEDVLFGFDPLFLGAWERDADFPLAVLPRADAKLALSTLQELDEPLGRGVWILDASDNNNFFRKLEIPLRSPEPRSAFEVRRFGPFLVIRTTAPTRTPAHYLERAAQALQVGKELYIGDADINLATVERARRALRASG